MDRQPLKKPDWIRFSLPKGGSYAKVRTLLKENQLNTICMEARCPNIGECMSCGTATFLILGDTCTRNCRYCSVQKGVPAAPDPTEPTRIAQMVQSIGLHYCVITSVTRDDLPDGGATHFASVVSSIQQLSPQTKIELLVPDFKDSLEHSLQVIMQTKPNVLNHNIEVVASLFAKLRPKGSYPLSLKLLQSASSLSEKVLWKVKSGLMIGLGETMDQIEETLTDLRKNGCQMVSIGQYLKSQKEGAEVEKYYTPQEFEEIKAKALKMGFLAVEAGPLVRSSYRASHMTQQIQK